MNESMLRNLSDSEFLSHTSPVTDLEKMLAERLAESAEDLRMAQDEVRACGIAAEESGLENFDADDLADELRERLATMPAKNLKATLEALVEGFEGVEVLCA